MKLAVIPQVAYCVGSALFAQPAFGRMIFYFLGRIIAGKGDTFASYFRQI